MITPALITACIAILLTVIQVFLSELYDFDLWLYRKWGWNKLADAWERRKKWGLPFNRILTALITIAAIVFLYYLKA